MRIFEHDDGLQFVELSNARLITVLKNILNAVPELLAEIAPDGFENTVFHRYYMVYMKRRYRGWLEFVKEHYKTNRPEKTFEEYCNTQYQKEGTYEMEIIVLLSVCLNDIFDFNSFVHDKKGGTYKRYYGFHFSRCLNKAILKSDNFKHLITKETEEYWRQLVFPTKHDRNIPIYRFIFRKLKEKNIDYHHALIARRHFNEFIGAMNTILQRAVENKALEDTDHEKNVLAELKAKEIEQERIKKQEEDPTKHIIDRLGDLKPPPIIEAYFDIYGDWPKGYPPVY